jgi:hypothetical protein
VSKLGAQMLIELGVHNEISHWAGTRTLKEVWVDCPRADWMSEILSKLGPWVINPPWDLVLECINTRDPARLRTLVPWLLIEYTVTKGNSPFARVQYD